MHYAFTNDGLELPVVDVTHSAFAQVVTDDEQKAQVDRYLNERQPLEHLPVSIRGWLLRAIFRGSALGPHLTTARSFLDGMGTYLLKLGQDRTLARTPRGSIASSSPRSPRSRCGGGCRIWHASLPTCPRPWSRTGRRGLST